jgi:hypothetical protein
MIQDTNAPIEQIEEATLRADLTAMEIARSIIYELCAKLEIYERLEAERGNGNWFALCMMKERELEKLRARQAVDVEAIIRDICEIPDRNSPDEDPTLLTVRAEELEVILERHLTQPQKSVTPRLRMNSVGQVDQSPPPDNNAAAVSGGEDKRVLYGVFYADGEFIDCFVTESGALKHAGLYKNSYVAPLYTTPQPDLRLAELERANAELIEQNTAIEKDQFEMGAKLAELMQILRPLVEARDKATKGVWNVSGAVAPFWTKLFAFTGPRRDDEMEIATKHGLGPNAENNLFFCSVAANIASQIAAIIAELQDGIKEEG